MRALDIKLFRDLWAMKGQGFAIAMVIAGGTATYILASSTLDSLRSTQTMLYREDLFADVFADVKRAPENVASRIAAIPGVQVVETRIHVPATLDLAGYENPISALVLSLPDDRRAVLNRLRLRSGRFPEPGREQEAVVSDGFAFAHKLQPGFTHRRHDLRPSQNAAGYRHCFFHGIHLPAPARIHHSGFQRIRDALDESRSGRDGLQHDRRLQSVSLLLDRGAVEQDVIARVDELLRPYGGLGAYGRKDQVSHKYLSEEFRQLTSMATIFPAIFLGVAAFLLNVVSTRLMATQRGQIAILKAFGYTTPAIAIHFLKLTMLIVVVGIVIGIAAGAWMGRGMSNMYMEFYRFPVLEYVLRRHVIFVSAPH